MIPVSFVSLPLTRFVRFMNEPQQPEQNPYEATQVAEMATSVTDRQKPGTVAVAFSVVLGLVLAVIAFGVSFFATCVGLVGIGAVDVDSALGLAFLFLVAGLTAVAAFVFTVWGLLTIVRALKS